MAPQGGFGLKVKIAVNSVLTAIVYVKEAEYPEFEKVLAESTTHGSPGGYAEWLATGKRNLSEFPVTLFWEAVESTHAAVLAAFDSNEYVAMSIEDPAGTEVIAFNAHIAKLGRVSEQEDGYMCEVTIQPTGQPTITPVGSA